MRTYAIGDIHGHLELLHAQHALIEKDVYKRQVYHAVEGGNGELGFYMISDGGRTPYRLHFRRPSFIYYQAFPEMCVGSTLSDAIVIMSSPNVIGGALDS